MEITNSVRVRRRFFSRVNILVRSLSTSGRAIFYVLAFLIIASSAGILFMLNDSLQVNVPLRGSSFSEGVIGSPRFINPVLAITDADRDMTTLIYSGLLKATPSGDLVSDLAQSYEVSPDGRTYTFHLRPNATFQDGTPLTADDVAFTIQKVLDPTLKSPLRANWQGVSVTVIDQHTITFTLNTAYAPFINNFTMGILPKHLWQNVSTQEFSFSSLNISPIGSGPYRIAGITRTPAGIATSYTLKSNSAYALGEPYIAIFSVKFYDNEDALMSALRSGDVEAGSSVSASLLGSTSDKTVLHVPLDRVFGVFFNQNNNPALQDSAVRHALSDVIDRTALVNAVFNGYALPLTGPIPPSLFSDSTTTSISPTVATSSANLIATAKAELAAAGWVSGSNGILQKTTGSGKNEQTIELAFTLSTSDVPELRAVAESVANTWNQLGAKVDVQVFAAGDLSENVIRPRKYDALLFGEIVGRGLDLFAFWDSSQRNDPGLNIALYANPAVDSLLSKLRTDPDESDRLSLYDQFETDIAKDAPAVFLYSPDFLYVVPNDLHGIQLGSIENPSDRFDTVQDWYRSMDHVWKIFAQPNNH